MGGRGWSEDRGGGGQGPWGGPAPWQGGMGGEQGWGGGNKRMRGMDDMGGGGGPRGVNQELMAENEALRRKVGIS